MVARSHCIHFALFLIAQLVLTGAYITRVNIPYSRFSNVMHLSGEDEPPSPPKIKNEVALMEIRTGKIVEIGVHPEADNLYVEQVDCGEETGPRTIVSGLVQFCAPEELLNKEVIVLCNLKPRALVGITSAGMLLCASNENHSEVAPISPPAGAPLGELVTFDGYESIPVDPGNKATKVWGKIAEDFTVNDDMVAAYKGVPFMTSKGPVTSTMKGGIS